jgi:RNA polymerase sigma factor (sigma-70 family)
MSDFPTTHHSAVLAARSDDPAARRRAYHAIVAAYWRPAYAYVRWHARAQPEEAQDLTQGFFAAAYENGFFERYDPTRARFRTWLRVCLDGHVSNARQAERRLKRGGGEVPLSLDFAAAESDLAARLPADTDDPETLFEREWVRALFESALVTLRERLASQDRAVVYALFSDYEIATGDRPSYAELARRHGIAETQVTNHLHRARRELRAIVLERLRELTIDEHEFRAEARRLLGRG